LRNEILHLNQELSGYKTQSSAAQKTLTQLTGNQLADTVAVSLTPKGTECTVGQIIILNSLGPELANDLCICFSDSTGPKAANFIKQYIDNATTFKATLLPCPLMTEATDFDVNAAEMSIASSHAVVLLVSDNSLPQATMVFALKTALLYGLSIITIHDLGSCPFPNVATLPPIYVV
jgi:hypothetical protein